MLVANKIDQYGDRMVFVEDGQRRYREIGCVGFREISVRESIEQVIARIIVLIFMLWMSVLCKLRVILPLYNGLRLVSNLHCHFILCFSIHM